MISSLGNCTHRSQCNTEHQITSPDVLVALETPSNCTKSSPTSQNGVQEPNIRELNPQVLMPISRPKSLVNGNHTSYATFYYSLHSPYYRYANEPPTCINGVIRMREGGSPLLSPSPGGAGTLTQGCSPNGSRGSLASIGTCSGYDELFRSPKHAESALKRMESYYSRGQLCDVTLVAGSRKIKAHRLVLSAASDYFAAMFTSPVLEASQDEVVMRNMDPDALLTLVNYCYTGSLELHEDTVEMMLSTAHQLLLTEVVEVCCDFLKKQLHPANCLGIQLFADAQGCSSLHRIACGYTADNFQDVIQNQEFLQLPVEEAAQLLASEDLNVPSEEMIFQALILWLKNDLDSRKKHTSRLLALVKLPLLSPQFLTDHIQTNCLFKEDRECQELIMEALKYHLLPERRLSLQSPRTRPRKSTVGALYVVGGMDANKGSTSIEKFDLRTNSWWTVTAMPGRRLQFGVAVVESKLFLVGGRDGLKTVNTVECFDPKTNQWTQLPAMSTHRHGLGVGVLSGPLYAVGGHDGWSYVNTVERWDPQTRQWSFVAPMSTPRSTVGVAVLNGRLYAVGGRDGSSCLRTVECYDPHTNKWTICAPMARRRGGVGVGVVNGFLYAVGGHDAPASNPSASRFDCVERYDPATDTWTQVGSLSVGCDSAGVSVLGDKLFCVGGYDGQTYLSMVQAYDPQTNEWVQMCPLPSGRAGACVVVLKNSQ